jgi:predicted transcriptional regulator of viral defense system
MWDKRRTHRGTALADAARRQHGVVSAKQLADFGFPRETIARWVKEQRLHRIGRGAYAVGHSSLTWEGHCMAAVLANSPAVASHRTAAWTWGLLRWRPEAFHLTAPTRRRTKRDFVVHFARLEDEDRAVVEGIPVTSVARTLLDLAPSESTDRLHRMMERAEERRAFDRRQFDRLLARAGGHRGRVKLRVALDTLKPEVALLRSGLEERFLALVLAAHLKLAHRIRVCVLLEAPEALDLGGSHAGGLGADVGGDPGRTSRCCEGRVTPDIRHATRKKSAYLERRRRAGGARRSVA